MKRRNINFKIFIIFLYFISFPLLMEAQVASTIVHGVVLDSITREPISYASIFLKGSDRGTVTDENGKFEIDTKVNFICLNISTIGFKEKSVFVNKGKINNIVVEMVPSSFSLNEVTIKPKKQKYSKKNNPAVEFVERLINQKDKYDPRNHDYYTYETYEKSVRALNDFSEEQKKNWLFKKFKFIFDYVDTSEVSGKPILTVGLKEKVSHTYFRRSPRTEKEIINGEKNTGIDEIFGQDNIKEFLNDIFKEVDIFSNDIDILHNRFVSPLSKIGTNFYMYFIDTIKVDGVKCIELSFAPHTPESFGFTGRLYVPADDSTLFVKKVKLNVPKAINLNYVDNIYLEQIYEKASDGSRLKVKDDMIVEFSIMPSTQGLYVRRYNSYKNHSFERPTDMSVFNFDGKVKMSAEALVQPEDFWKDNRHIPVKQKENAVNKLLGRLREVPAFYWSEKIISVLISGYIPTGTNSKFDVGPMNTTISFDEVQGARFRVGGATTANLNSRLFANGYMAYGTRDGRFKYMGQLEYSFLDKKYHSQEFPVHSISLSHKYDVDQLGQHYDYTNMDNVFMSLKRSGNTKVTYHRVTNLKYTLEKKGGFSIKLSLNHDIQYGTQWVNFIDGYGNRYPDFGQAWLEAQIRYAPGEKFYQTKTQRIPMNFDAPVITLIHKFGLKGILGSKYNLNQTELKLSKRFWFSAFGYTDLSLCGGKIWSQVAFPLLILPNANLSYTIQPNAYSLMSPMEFINDSYVSWDVTYYANGALFNRLPLLKYMKWREVVEFKGLYGTLSDKNNPIYNSNLFQFPAGSGWASMGKMPYMEISVGLDNILTFLRVDYVWRLSYRDTPGVSKGGVRIALHFGF